MALTYKNMSVSRTSSTTPCSGLVGSVTITHPQMIDLTDINSALCLLLEQTFWSYKDWESAVGASVGASKERIRASGWRVVSTVQAKRKISCAKNGFSAIFTMIKSYLGWLWKLELQWR